MLNARSFSLHKSMRGKGAREKGKGEGRQGRERGRPNGGKVHRRNSLTMFPSKLGALPLLPLTPIPIFPGVAGSSVLNPVKRQTQIIPQTQENA